MTPLKDVKAGDYVVLPGETHERIVYTRAEMDDGDIVVLGFDMDRTNEIEKKVFEADDEINVSHKWPSAPWDTRC